MVFDKIKKSLFSTKIYSYNGERYVAFKMPRKSKIKLDLDTQNNNFSVIFPDGEKSSPFNAVYFYETSSKIITIRKNDDQNTKMLIDCSTGIHSPECTRIQKKFVVDTQNAIHKIDVEDGLKIEKTNLSLKYLYPLSNCMVCKDENDNNLIVKKDNLDIIANLGKQGDNVSYLKVRGENDEIFSFDNRHFFFKEGEFVELPSGDIIESMTVWNSNKLALKICDENSNKTKVIIYNENDIKSFQQFDIDSQVFSVIENGDKMLFLCRNQNNKFGIIDENNKTVVPFNYDDIDIEKLTGNYNESKRVFLVKSDKKQGLIDLTGKEILPCEYDNIDLTVSRMYNGKYRILAEKNKLYGVVNSANEVEVDFNYVLRGYAYSPFYYKKEGLSSRQHGLELYNAKTGKKDYLTMGEEKCIHHAADIEEYHYAYEQNQESRTKTVEVNKYSDDEIFGAAVISSVAFDSPVVGMLVANQMSEAKETKEVSVDGEEMSY